MNVMTAAKCFLASKPSVFFRTFRALNETYRAAFVSTAAAEGVLELLRRGPQEATTIASALGLDGSVKELETWLDLGVSLGELRRDSDGRYRLRGALSRRLAEPDNDTPLAYLRARIEVILDYVTKTPERLRRGERFTLDDGIGELFARSSRTVEPLLFDLVDRVVPETGRCRLLEVGCGSGVYIRRACRRNEELEAVGIDLSRQAADFARKNLDDWGLGDRVQVETGDIRAFSDGGGFDIVTFYNLIYYFPESERPAVLGHLYELVRPGGLLVLMTITKGGNPATRTMDLWSTMTEGCGPLPSRSQLEDQLDEAGFSPVELEVSFADFVICRASRPRA